MQPAPLRFRGDTAIQVTDVLHGLWQRQALTPTAKQVSPAAEPEHIRWEYLDTKPWTRTWRRGCTWVIVALILAIAYSTLLFANTMRRVCTAVLGVFPFATGTSTPLTHGPVCCAGLSAEPVPQRERLQPACPC